MTLPAGTVSPSRRNHILTSMTRNRAAPFAQPEEQPQKYTPVQRVGPVERGPVGTVTPVQATPAAPPTTNQRDAAVQQNHAAMQQQFMNRVAPFAQGQMSSPFTRRFNFPAQRPTQFANYASAVDQHLAGMRGQRAPQAMRQRPFANYYMGPRQGRGGLQPVASPQDASRRQRMQELYSRFNRQSTSSGAPAGRRLARRSVFA